LDYDVLKRHIEDLNHKINNEDMQDLEDGYYSSMTGEYGRLAFDLANRLYAEINGTANQNKCDCGAELILNGKCAVCYQWPADCRCSR
jgi:hypothetical protein